MNDSGSSCCPNPKAVLWTLAIFAAFGFLVLILTGRLGPASPENKAFAGEFTAETTALRLANRKEVDEAQAGLVDAAKVDAAFAALAKAPAKPAATQVLVPGSPTFLKQAEQSAAPATPTDAKAAPAAPDAKAAPEAKAPDAPAKAAPAPAPAKPAAAPAPAPAPAKPAPAKPAAAPAPADAAAKPAPAKPAPAPANPAPEAKAK